MGHYVYRYMHPDYPWLYVGKTDANLATRIKTHDTCKDDNISREHLLLLKESVVLYIELQNSVQSTYVEKMLIDKYKPLLNKMDKVDGDCPIEFVLPKWKKFIRKSDIPEEPIKGSVSVKNIRCQITDTSKELETAEAELSNVCDRFVQTKQMIEALQVQSSICPVTPSKDLYTVSLEEVVDFYKKYPDSKEYFFSCGYGIYGEPIYFDVNKDGIKLGRNEDKTDRVKLDAMFASVFFAQGEFFGGVFPSSVAGYIMLKRIYENRYNEMTSRLHSLALESVNDVDVLNCSLVGYIGNDEYEVTSTPSCEETFGYCSISKNREKFFYANEINSEFPYDANKTKEVITDLLKNEDIKWYIKGGNFPYLSSRNDIKNIIDKIEDSINSLWKES